VCISRQIYSIPYVGVERLVTTDAVGVVSTPPNPTTQLRRDPARAQCHSDKRRLAGFCCEKARDGCTMEPRRVVEAKLPKMERGD
jgi:hypothetical protein